VKSPVAKEEINYLACYGEMSRLATEKHCGSPNKTVRANTEAAEENSVYNPSHYPYFQIHN